MNVQEEKRRSFEPANELELSRNSPTSAVCYLNLLDPSLGAPAPREDARDNGDGDRPAPGGSVSSMVASGGPERTPRSELPTSTESSAVWHSHSSPSETIPQAQPVPSEPSYFSPKPLRYYHTSLPKSNNTSTDSSPNHSTNASTTSVNLERVPFPRSTSNPSERLDRPGVHRDVSSSSTATNSTVRPGHGAYMLEYPQFPNQAYSALHTQNHPPPYIPHAIRTGYSYQSQPTSLSASQVSTLSQPSNHDRTEQGSRTVGNSPASSPGLFTPNTPSVKPFDGGEGFYSSPYLHYTHRQIPKETHVADVDFDPVSGRKIINQYEVIDELGRGVHGKVKLGKNLETGQFVAIKIVDRFSKRRRLGKTNSYEDKIRREIAILKKARNPNIVSLLEVIDDPTVKKVYIILEHVELGEIKWRIEGAKEIVLLEYRRCEREARGIFDSDSAVIEDEQIFQAATRRRERKERQLWKELQRRNKRSEHEPWSFEHGGDSEDDDSEHASLSRVSTATAHQPNVDQPNDGDDQLSPAKTFIQGSQESTFTSARHQGYSVGEPSTGLEGTMYGAYETEVPRGRTPSIAGSASSASLDVDNIDFVPEHYRYVPLMTLSSVRAAIRDTILGLEYLHYQGIVHRDIKPANLLQTKDHRIKISDFGVSYLGRTAGDETSGDVSESDALDVDEAVELAKTVGTPAFYAPELCRTDEDADPLEVTQAIDVWAVGVTLYCLIYGRVPFHDENPFVLMRKIAEEDVYIPHKRLKAVDEQAGSRPSSHGRQIQPINSNKRAPHDLEYEDVDDELVDFLRKLFEKDPRKRITLKAAKMHPWLLRDIPNPESWYKETEPEKQTQGKRIELTKEDISTAVVPLTFKDKIVAGIRKIGGALVGRSASTRGRRDRARSSVTPSEGLASSATSSSSTISQDARRPSLRVDEQLFAALKNSREHEHPLSQSQTASLEAEDQRHFFNGPSSRPHSPIVRPADSQLPSNASHRATGVDRTCSTMSTATSVRTIRPSDITRTPQRPTASLQLTALPSAPLLVDTPATPSLSGIFGGASRRAPYSVRAHDGCTTTQSNRQRARSADQLANVDDDPHAQPSIALSDTVAAGHVDMPEVLRGSSPSNMCSIPNSPQIHAHGQCDRLHPDSATNTPSRQSSISSVSSHLYESRQIMEERPSTRGSGILSSVNRNSSDERFARTRDEAMRHRIVDDSQISKTPSYSRPPSALSQSTCPPSLEDDLDYQKPREGNTPIDRRVDIPSSLETSPMSRPFNPKALNSSSSEDQFTSGLSQSTSNPSIPSVISANSSIAAEEGALEPYKEITRRSSRDTLNPALAQPFEYDGYATDPVVESADDEGEDDDDDDFIEITRPNRQSKVLVRRGSISNVEPSRRRHYHSPTSSRSARSGSGGTVRKPRSHGASPDASLSPEPTHEQDVKHESTRG